MPLRASSHPGSPNSPSCSALAWYSCWPGLSPWGESWKRTRVARTAALTHYRYATQPTKKWRPWWLWYLMSRISLCNESLYYGCFKTVWYGYIFSQHCNKPPNVYVTCYKSILSMETTWCHKHHFAGSFYIWSCGLQRYCVPLTYWNTNSEVWTMASSL